MYMYYFKTWVILSLATLWLYQHVNGCPLAPQGSYWPYWSVENLNDTNFYPFRPGGNRDVETNKVIPKKFVYLIKTLTLLKLTFPAKNWLSTIYVNTHRIPSVTKRMKKLNGFLSRLTLTLTFEGHLADEISNKTCFCEETCR